MRFFLLQSIKEDILKKCLQSLVKKYNGSQWELKLLANMHPSIIHRRKKQVIEIWNKGDYRLNNYRMFMFGRIINPLKKQQSFF